MKFCGNSWMLSKTSTSNIVTYYVNVVLFIDKKLLFANRHIK